MDEGAEPPQATADEATVASGVELLSLKDGQTFLVGDHNGDLIGGADGLFNRDTRVLSRLVFMIGDRHPTRLSSTLSKDNAVFTFHGTNRALPPVNGRGTPRGAIHIERRRTLSGERLYERVRCTNFGLDQVMLPLVFEYAADFRDMFEVRGVRRRERGTMQPSQLLGRHVLFAYAGLDDVLRTSTLAFSEPPWRMDDTRAEFMFTLAPGERIDLFIEAGAGEAEAPSRERFRQALANARRTIRKRERRGALVRCSDDAHSAWFEQSRADLGLLVSEMATGPYPFAGIPWFSTPFGRDGILTALFALWVDPSIAKGVLRFLAATQSTDFDPEREAEPGKILHEMRDGEMARLREVPFARYYGSVDATPLFVLLVGEYFRRTGDLDTIRELWPNIQAALHWIDTYGDPDGDGFVEYQRQNAEGLINQGWKDSHDAIFHEDGRLAEGPIALCEVQAYVYGSKRHAAELALALDHSVAAATLSHQADALREQFEAAFWCDELATYALALDGAKQPCRVTSSNAGHALLTGIAAPERAARVADTLLGTSCFSGWGVRTVARSAARYNPISYHNGSVWPHDNAVIALGLARYGLKSGVLRIFKGLFQAASYMDLRRLPELFCGFAWRQLTAPTLYPVACAPQAWASATVFALLQASLSLSFDQTGDEIRFDRPVLPDFLDHLHLRGLQGRHGVADILLRRYGSEVSVDITRRQGKVPIVIVR